ncbi:MAG: hypothetical protein ABIF10_06475 [Candidatus Woesearchaeota archaeon]
MKNYIFTPTVAKFADDLRTSMEVLNPAKALGYEPCLMLVIQKGLQGVTEDAEKQCKNLEDKAKEFKDNPVITMLSNMPIHEIDFLNNTYFAVDHVKKGIDFAEKLPIGGRRIVTFHLNTLVSRQEFEGTSQEIWDEKLSTKILPALEIVAKYSKDKGIEAKIEPVGVPEFGDIPDSDERNYQGVRLNQLRNPFYISSSSMFERIYNAGLGICLDLCHNRTIYKAVVTGDIEKVLLPRDRENLLGRTLLDDVRQLQKTDIVHLNDGAGIYSDEKKTVYLEGVPLGKGDISDLPYIVGYLNIVQIPFVLEVDEQGDFKNRPGTKHSLEYLGMLASPITTVKNLFETHNNPTTGFYRTPPLFLLDD